MRLAMSIKKRTKSFTRILTFLLNHYFPSWFAIKNEPHCQSGAKHFFLMLELSKDLCLGSQKVVHKVLQDNATFAHPENLVIACLADQREEIRRKAVLYIMAARRDFDIDSHPRQFLPPTINTKVGNLLLTFRAIGTSGLRSSQWAFGRSTGNDVSGHSNVFIFFPFFPVFLLRCDLFS